MKKSELKQLIREEIEKKQLNESFFENTVLGNILILMWDSSVGGVLDRAKAKRMAQTIKSDPSLINKFKAALGEGGKTLKEFIQTIYYMTFGNHKI